MVKYRNNAIKVSLGDVLMTERKEEKDLLVNSVILSFLCGSVFGNAIVQ